MKTNDGAWAALTPDAASGVSFVTNAPLEASAHPRCLSDAGFSAAVVLNTGIDYAPISVEINQCVGSRQFFTKSFLCDGVAALARSSGEEPTPPRHRAGVASMACERVVKFEFHTGRDGRRGRRDAPGRLRGAGGLQL